MQNIQKKLQVDKEPNRFCVPGAVREKDGVRFTVAVPKGQKAELLLYHKKDGQEILREAFPQMPAVGELRTMKVRGIAWRETAYLFVIGKKTVCDPYARVILEGGGGQLLSGFSFEEFNWKEDKKPGISYRDGVLYHLHVRNFTMHKKSRVRHKGTFLGLQEKIPYLKELGVNQVKLMPAYEFEQLPEEEKDHPALSKESMPNCWGYGAKAFYFAPNRRYAAAGSAVREFKTMVQAFHANAMEVILEMFFSPEMPAKTVIECLEFWVREYHADGFHLIGREDAVPLLRENPVLAQSKIFTGSCAQIPTGKKESTEIREKCFAECNDGFLVEARRLLKGDEGVLESFSQRFRRNPGEFACVNYITNHDGFTLQDLVSYDTKHNEENGQDNQDGARYDFSWNCGVEGPSRKKDIQKLRRQQMKNALLMVLLSQGTPMLLAGDEFGNSQNGNNNPYCLDNETSWVDWGAALRNKGLTEFVKKALAFRMAHPVLRMEEEPRMMDYKSCGYPDLSYHSGRAWYGDFEYGSRQLGMMYCGLYTEREEFLYIAWNLNPMEQELALPKLPAGLVWEKLADTSLEESFLEGEERQALEKDQRTMVFPARSVSILKSRKKSRKVS